MLRGELLLLLLICAAGRDLAPLCTLKSKSGTYFVYNGEQWLRRDPELDAKIKFKVGEYHNLTCFKKTEPPGVHDSLEAKLFIGKASKMYAVQGGPIKLNKNDICYGWPETEPQFTRGPTSWKIERKNTFSRQHVGKCEDSQCLELFNSKRFNLSLAIECMNNTPRVCSVEEIYKMQAAPISPYKGTGYKVQSFNGLVTLNHDIVSRDLVSESNGNEIVAPRWTELLVILKENRRSDCYLLFSAYSPLTGKSLPIRYMKFAKWYDRSSIFLMERLSASLYNMGEFDLQFINNHRTHPCDADSIDRIEAVTTFSVIRGPAKFMSLMNKFCHDGVSTNLVITFFLEWYDIHYSLEQFLNSDFEVPINLWLGYRHKNSAAQIDQWEVYGSGKGFTEGPCSMGYNRKAVWTPLRVTISPKRVYTGTELGGEVVEVEIRVELLHTTKFPRHIQIRNFCTDCEDVSLLSVTLGGPRSERPEPNDDLDLIDAKEPMESIQITRRNSIDVRFSVTGDRMIVPIELPKYRRTSRDFRNWDTVYWNIDSNGDCLGYYKVATPGYPTNGSFWDCRSKFKIDDTKFAVSRSASFDKSEIPRLWGVIPDQIFGYAIDLALPPCAQSLTQLTELKFSVAYTNLIRGDKCRHNLKGTASQNLPEFSPSVYFEWIEVYDPFIGRDIPFGIENGKSLSHYWFDPRGVVKRIETLPRSIVIGYDAKLDFCADKIETIKVTYELEYSP